MEKALESNIWKYTISLIVNKRVFIAILGAYYLTIPNVNAWWIGVLLSIGNLIGFVLEVPSGYFADKFGHKQTLVLARVLGAGSSFFLLTAHSIPFLVVGAALISACHAFQSGTGSAFMHETLRALGRESEYAKITGKQAAIGYAIPAVLAAFIPLSVAISYRIPFAFGLLLDLIGVFVVSRLAVPPVTPERVEEIRSTNFTQVVREGRRLHYFRFGILSGIVSGTLMAFMVFRAPYQLLLGVPVIWFGIFFGLGRGLAALMLATTKHIYKWFKDIYAFELFKICLYTSILVIFSLISSPWVIVLLFMVTNAFQWGLGQVSQTFLINIIRESKFKATFLSIGAQVQTIVAAVVAFAFGYAVQLFGYSRAFLLLAIAFALILVPYYLVLARTRTNVRQSK